MRQSTFEHARQCGLVRRFASGAAPVMLLALLLALSACGHKDFQDGDVRAVKAVYTGTVINVTEIMVLESPDNVRAGVGAAIGAGLGGGLGYIVGETSGLVIGGLIGAYGGSEVAGGGKYGTRQYPAMHITMDLDNGRTLVVVQGYDEYFVKGDKVRVLNMGDGRARVQLQ
ncbi:hypothetical protein LJC46_09665 [Desulfovibrio sp. OttesenSCG-928-G15]|nr:hypothetical protein [Desulfovibrio sp. OttesenSCG-928-G15]